MQYRLWSFTLGIQNPRLLPKSELFPRVPSYILKWSDGEPSKFWPIFTKIIFFKQDSWKVPEKNNCTFNNNKKKSSLWNISKSYVESQNLTSFNFMQSFNFKRYQVFFEHINPLRLKHTNFVSLDSITGNAITKVPHCKLMTIDLVIFHLG